MTILSISLIRVKKFVSKVEFVAKKNTLSFFKMMYVKKAVEWIDRNGTVTR